MVEFRPEGLATLISKEYRPNYGIHRYDLQNGSVITGISAPNWPAFIGYLSEIRPSDRLVVSPELMTVAGHSPLEVKTMAGLVEERFKAVKDKSEACPETTFLLGTPTYPKEGRPRNSIVFIKNGEMIGVTNKRSGATHEERESFDLPAEEPPVLIPGTNIGVLVCADLGTATLYLNKMENLDRILELSGRTNLIHKRPRFIDPSARSLVVPCCWGVGGNQAAMKRLNPDSYYRLQLEGVARNVLANSAVEEVAVVDRVPEVEEELKPYTPTKPLNAFITKEG